MSRGCGCVVRARISFDIGCLVPNKSIVSFIQPKIIGAVLVRLNEVLIPPHGSTKPRISWIPDAPQQTHFENQIRFNPGCNIVSPVHAHQGHANEKGLEDRVGNAQIRQAHIDAACAHGIVVVGSGRPKVLGDLYGLHHAPLSESQRVLETPKGLVFMGRHGERKERQDRRHSDGKAHDDGC